MTSTLPVEATAVTLEDIQRAAVPVRREADRSQWHTTLHPACVIIEHATPAWGVAPLAAAHLYLRDEAEDQVKECGSVDEDVQALLTLLKRFVEEESTMYFQDGSWTERVYGKTVAVPETFLRR